LIDAPCLIRLPYYIAMRVREQLRCG